MCLGKELTYEQRVQLEMLKNEGYSNSHIAKILGKHRSTIGRELKRVTNTRYTYKLAQEHHSKMSAYRGRNLSIGSNQKLARLIEKLIIEEHLSPRCAVGAIRRKTDFENVPCANSIYSYIDNGFIAVRRYHLPNFGKSRKGKKKSYYISNRTKGTSIEQRPEEINDRSEFGHFEGDLVLGSKAKNPVVMTLTERKTRFNIDVWLPDKTQQSVIAGLNVIERYLKNEFNLNFHDLIKSITFDNGSEFLDFKGIEKSCFNDEKRTKTYYAHPFASHERGTNERNNGMLRRFGLKKKCDYSKFSVKKLQVITDKVNSYPRPIFDFRSAIDEFTDATGLPRNIITAFKVKVA